MEEELLEILDELDLNNIEADDAFKQIAALISIGNPEIDCDHCYETEGFYLGISCPECNRPFRSLINKPAEQEKVNKMQVRKYEHDLLFSVNGYEPNKEDKDCVLLNFGRTILNFKSIEELEGFTFEILTKIIPEIRKNYEV